MKKSQVLLLCVVVVAGIAVLRMGGGGSPAGVEARDAIRVLACRKCQSLELVGAETIRQRYMDEQVGEGPGGVVFGCSSCGQLSANSINIDVQSERVGCPACGWAGPSSTSGIGNLIEREKATCSPRGALKFRCPTCEDFTGLLTAATEPTGGS